MSPRFRVSTLVTLLFLAGSCVGQPIWAQDCPCPSAQQSSTQNLEAYFADAANKWQLTAIDPKSQVDTVTPDVRELRDAYWKVPLEAVRGTNGVAGAMTSEMPPEFPVQPGDVWVIATFENFHVFEINNDPALIYTEMNFRVEHVFRQPSNLSLSTGSLVDAGITGGRVRTAKGDVISQDSLRPISNFIEPGHKYLIQLETRSQGVVFLPGKRWDVSSGKVQEVPGSQEAERAAQGKSAIAGMSVADLVNYFPSILPEEPKTEEPGK